ncbi:hypothetical protein [Streptomyces sp. NPDC058466]|uniref:hypothetical protein n=1 Tax=Streptomyces sp. NPDC058466 TaxID=3346512 RepID=UPI0036627A3F
MYASRPNGAYLRRRGIRCTIPGKADPARTRRRRGSGGGRPPKFDPVDHRSAPPSSAAPTPSRGTVHSHEMRQLAVRYEATVLVAAVNEWL